MVIKEKLRILLVVASFLLLTTAVANAKTIYVDADVSGGGGGTTWADGYKYLQDALDDADASTKPVEIRVAQGTYKPDDGASVTSGVRTETFQLINGVTLEGGYAGDGEVDPNARDISNNVTTLSGDLDGDDVPVATNNLLTDPNRAENSYHVVTGDSIDPNAVLDGFTITAGCANGSYPYNYGGGMYSKSNPTVTNCTFSSNAADYGGGMVQNDGSGTLLDCVFNGNYCKWSGGGVGVRFAELDLINCRFLKNSSGSIGGGISLTMLDGQISKLTNSTFSGNSATFGGGMGITHGDANLANCTFSENSAGNAGGGFFILINGGTAIFDNCIFWGNTADGEGPQIGLGTVDATVDINYSDVQGGELDIYVSAGTLNYDPNNINSDPLFVDADGADNTAGTEDDDLHLLWSSPCINTGDPSIVFNINERDIDGEPS